MGDGPRKQRLDQLKEIRELRAAQAEKIEVKVSGSLIDSFSMADLAWMLLVIQLIKEKERIFAILEAAVQ